MKSYTIRQASSVLEMSVRTLREWVRNGKIKAVKYPGSNIWRIPESEITRVVGGINENKSG